MGFRLLIADDSEIQIESILSYVNWKELDVTDIMTARDGMEALEISKEFRPHIAIIDVEMPKLDGLELARQLRASDKRIKMIFISCHEKFAYAQKAMSYGGSAYILKPISSDELYDTAKNILDELSFEEDYTSISSEFLDRQAKFEKSFYPVDKPESDKLDIFVIQKEILSFVEDGNADNIVPYFNNKYFAALAHKSFDYTKYLCYSIINALQLVSRLKGADMGKIFGSDDIFWDKLATFENGEDIINWLKNLLCLMVKHIIEIEGDKNKKLVNDIQAKINNNLYDIESVEQIAKELNISSSHAKNVFKKYTGITIFDYLFEKRMKEAEKLLSETDLHIYQIAEKVGYKSKAYFSTAFQKYTGTTPNEYRKERGI